MLEFDKAQTFNDGLINIYKSESSAGDGDMPTKAPQLFLALRFREMSLTLTRQYEAKSVGYDIDRLVRIHDVAGIEPDMLVEVTDRHGKNAYRIRAVMDVVQTTPPTLTLGLEKLRDDDEFEPID